MIKVVKIKTSQNKSSLQIVKGKFKSKHYLVPYLVLYLVSHLVLHLVDYYLVAHLMQLLFS